MREKNPSAAHSVNSPAQQPLTSRNTCWSIQERSLSDVTSVTIVVLKLVIWGATCSHTLEKSPLRVSSAATLPDDRRIWSPTCFHTLARNLFPVSNVITPAKSWRSRGNARESTPQKECTYIDCNQRSLDKAANFTFFQVEVAKDKNKWLSHTLNLTWLKSLKYSENQWK